MLSDLLVKLSPSPPISRKRQIEITQQTQQQQQGLSSLITDKYDQESSSSSFISTSNKRSRPLQSQSLTRNEDYRHIRQYPKSLEIFIPYQKIDKQQQQEKETTITRTYEYERRRSLSENARPQQQPRRYDLEIASEYLRCLDDLTDEYEKLAQQQQQQQQQHQQPKRKFLETENKKKAKYETTEQYETIEKISHYQPRKPIENTYQRSSSENFIHKRLKPITTYDTTLSEDDLFHIEYRLRPKERLKPIHIHSSNSSIPGETSIKYVRTERLPIEVHIPKPQIFTTYGEHSSTTLKDNRHTSRKITTNIHQQGRRRTIEGQHELRIIEQPITSEQTRTVEFTIPKPILSLPNEHTSTYVVQSKKGRRYHTIDISQSLTRQHTLSGEHELRIIEQPINSNLMNKPVEFLFPKSNLQTVSSQHSSTIVKQNRTPRSTLLLDNIQTIIKGEHELRLVDKPIQSGPNDSVEFIIPKSVTDIVEHTTTMVTETQPHRRVLEITGSGKKMESEHERKYFHDTVRVEEEIQVKLPKQKLQQGEHSATIIKHSRGKGPIIEIDTKQRTMEGEHETKVIKQAIQTKADTMQLLVAKPQIPAEHSTTIVKGQRGKTQIVEIDCTQSIPGMSHFLSFFLKSLSLSILYLIR